MKKEAAKKAFKESLIPKTANAEQIYKNIWEPAFKAGFLEGQKNKPSKTLEK